MIFFPVLCSELGGRSLMGALDWPEQFIGYTVTLHYPPLQIRLNRQRWVIGGISVDFVHVED